ncbi:phage tail protein, partial [Escherichia coli]|nr:phage tail protein [Escherichia coli]
MAIETFTWCPRLNAEADINFRVRKAQFGDGYQQVSGDGINPRSQKWTLQFTGTETYIGAIKDFLDRH